jgi:hypothetical protein
MARRFRYSKPAYAGKNTQYFDPYFKCDTSGLMFPLSQRVKQMRQAADTVYWDGAFVHPMFLDPLDDQKRTPPIATPDPPIVDQPRPNPVWLYGKYEPSES